MFNYSIIIPHKNIPSLLRRCLDSIPERNDLEIIVVDDSSNEETIKDLQKIHRNNLQIIYTKEGKGAGYARNVGINNAHGKWILFADADDFFLPDLLKKLDSYKDKNYSIVLFHSICRSSDNLEKKGNRQDLCDIFSSRLKAFQKGESSALNLFLGLGVPWAKMIQLSFLQKNCIKFEEVRYSNDIGWITQIALKARNNDVAVSNEKLYCLTDREKSLYYTHDREAFYCRFGVRYRQHQLLKKNGIPSYFNFCPYVDEARKFGIPFLLNFYKYILQPEHHIPAIYKFEKFFHLKAPYFYLFFQLIKEFLIQTKITALKIFKIRQNNNHIKKAHEFLTI